jgi:chemotaxis protein histidine kinase CheA
MTRAQVEALDGKIGIKSKVNKGTQFTIYLPLEAAS